MFMWGVDIYGDVSTGSWVLKHLSSLVQSCQFRWPYCRLNFLMLWLITEIWAIDCLVSSLASICQCSCGLSSLQDNNVTWHSTMSDTLISKTRYCDIGSNQVVTEMGLHWFPQWFTAVSLRISFIHRHQSICSAVPKPDKTHQLWEII